MSNGTKLRIAGYATLFVGIDVITGLISQALWHTLWLDAAVIIDIQLAAFGFLFLSLGDYYKRTPLLLAGALCWFCCAAETFALVVYAGSHSVLWSVVSGLAVLMVTVGIEVVLIGDAVVEKETMRRH